MIEEVFSETFPRLIWLLLICLPFTALAVETPSAPASSNAVPILEPAPSSAPLTNLTFDAEAKEYHGNAGDKVGTFTFQVTNVSDIPVHILEIKPTCSCTHADLPETPWILLPHARGEFHATMRLSGIPGENLKGLTVISTNGTKQLLVKSIIPAPDTAMMGRQKNQELAKADRQAVFKNDCAACHVDKSRGLMGAALYKEACGICHDSDHRASMVPDLGSLNHPTDAAFWRTMIAEGKDKTLMPAFSEGRGGPLSAQQIDSLVDYMTGEFPREHKPTPQVPFPTTVPIPARMPGARVGFKPPQPSGFPAAPSVHP